MFGWGVGRGDFGMVRCDVKSCEISRCSVAMKHTFSLEASLAVRSLVRLRRFGTVP